MIHFRADECQDLTYSLEREWLETNGLGGFASATVAGANTRRYHGLLTAALRPPVERYVLLSSVQERVSLDGKQYELSTNLYTGAVHPRGYELLEGFRLNPFPISTYSLAGIEIEKRVFMVQGENTTVIEYEIMTNANCRLELRPLIAFRDYHSTTHANDAIRKTYAVSPGLIRLQPYDGLPELQLAHNAQRTEPDGNWYYRFDYPRERERGLDFEEDLFAPVALEYELAPGRAAILIASTKTHAAESAERLKAGEMARRASIGTPPREKRAYQPGHNADPFAGALLRAADQFLVRRSRNLQTVIAGYHWFSDWGRDTMIALPGLTLVTGGFDAARNILLAFAEAVDAGMLPNRFADTGEQPEYNTVDASLWYFEAIRKFLAYTGDFAFVRDRLYPQLKSILNCHLSGTRYGIVCDKDGLLRAGSPATQLTWMDVKIGDRAVTPRNGKAVEIQALWYNALRFTESLASRFGDDEFAARLAAVAAHTFTSFGEQFWNPDTGCLFDVVDGHERDASIRPNQVIALSLEHTMVDPEQARSILRVVEQELLTPYGLRTLNRSDPRYTGKCDGPPAKRDAAYHQGTVWPWLLGPFITAYLREFPEQHEEAREWLRPLEGHLTDAGLGTISEIFDGDPPHTPRGCIAQAWSVAEILRVLVEQFGAPVHS